MKKVPLGKSNVLISAMCLGCMNFGTRTDEDTAFKLLDYYYDKGGRFLDTANNYAFWEENGYGGESEALIGRWLKSRNVRDQIFLATKVGANPTDLELGFDSAEGLTAKAIHKAVEESLQRLGTDYIDLYYAHIDHRPSPLEETLKALNKLVKEGKVRHIGCSNIHTWRIEQAKNISRNHQWEEYICVQQRFSYLRPKPGADFGIQVSANEELLDYCQSRKDFTLLAYSPLLHGTYNTKNQKLPDHYEGPDSMKRIDVLAQVAEDKGATMNQIVLAWMVQMNPRVIPLIAGSSIDQLEENIKALDIHLSPQEMKLLTEATG
ncbi:aldo/keto reductase [Metabacillus niabensis]|uniref:aldo/keto reductase n=1 Tax=Metabacillus niabensis TaxID=324854 RepID=UPI001CF96500|nr:aldo/keto reductase [Metabacillus niabensis]